MPDAMREFVALENIKRFEHEIAKTTNAGQRSLLQEMLLTEQGNLRAARAESC
jgi:hypothetical protein